MKCPIDGAELVMTDRAGVEIDYCPQCRGVWLDRGELDKIIERSSPPAAPQQRIEPQAWQEQPSHKHRKKKRGGFLEDLFDF